MAVRAKRLPGDAPAGKNAVSKSKAVSPPKSAKRPRKAAPGSADALPDDIEPIEGDTDASEIAPVRPHNRSHKRSAVDRLNDPPPVPLPALLSRVSTAIERELTQIEIIVGGARVKPTERTEAERRARTLASLARTLREVMNLRAGEEKTRQDDDALPRDLDELRHQLAQRLDLLVAEAKTAHPGETE